MFLQSSHIKAVFIFLHHGLNLLGVGIFLDDGASLLFPDTERGVGRHHTHQTAEVKEMASLTTGVESVHQPAR